MVRTRNLRGLQRKGKKLSREILGMWKLKQLFEEQIGLSQGERGSIENLRGRNDSLQLDVSEVAVCPTGKVWVGGRLKALRSQSPEGRRGDLFKPLAPESWLLSRVKTSQKLDEMKIISSPIEIQEQRWEEVNDSTYQSLLSKTPALKKSSFLNILFSV